MIMLLIHPAVVVRLQELQDCGSPLSPVHHARARKERREPPQSEPKAKQEPELGPEVEAPVANPAAAPVFALPEEEPAVPAELPEPLQPTRQPGPEPEELDPLAPALAARLAGGLQAERQQWAAALASYDEGFKLLSAYLKTYGGGGRIDSDAELRASCKRLLAELSAEQCSCCMRLEDWAQAKKCAEMSLKVAPDSAKFQQRLATIEHNLRGGSLQPDNWQAFALHAHDLMEQGSWEQARPLLRRALGALDDNAGSKDARDRVRMLTQLAKCHAMQEQHEQALETAVRAAAVDPRYGFAQLAPANCHFALEQYSEAHACYTRALGLGLSPQNAEVALHGLQRAAAAAAEAEAARAAAAAAEVARRAAEAEAARLSALRADADEATRLAAEAAKFARAARQLAEREERLSLANQGRWAEQAALSFSPAGAGASPAAPPAAPPARAGAGAAKPSKIECAGCGTIAPSKLRGCSACRLAGRPRFPRYCDASCQSLHWSAGHAEQCAAGVPRDSSDDDDDGGGGDDSAGTASYSWSRG